MSAKQVPPSRAAQSFSCPHCGAIAHQTWYWVYVDECDAGPSLFNMAGPVLRNSDGVLVNTKVENTFFSQCFSCEGLAIWVADNIVEPRHIYKIEPNVDMPPDVVLDFKEASSIIDLSPRGATALLRLAIQKIMIHLELPGKDLNKEIGTLVSRGLDHRIQRALDVVRVIGNNSVHPGQIDLRDDKATASRLFHLVNIIVEAMISAPKHIEEMYEGLPEGAKKAIAKRDKKDQNSAP